jgi:hypothetical protein
VKPYAGYCYDTGSANTCNLRCGAPVLTCGPSNDNWEASLAPTFTSVGAFAFPIGSKDAALLQTVSGATNEAHLPMSEQPDEGLSSPAFGSGFHLPTPEELDTETEPESETPRLRRLGRYRIERLISSGGMANVYLALQDHPRRHVALKVVRPGAAARAALARFRREAELLGRLEHLELCRSHSFPPSNLGRIALGISKANPKSIYTLMSDSKELILYFMFSQDEGTSWEQVDFPDMTIGGKDFHACMGEQGSYNLNIAVDPTDSNTVYLSGVTLFKAIRKC